MLATKAALGCWLCGATARYDGKVGRLVCADHRAPVAAQTDTASQVRALLQAHTPTLPQYRLTTLRVEFEGRIVSMRQFVPGWLMLGSELYYCVGRTLDAHGRHELAIAELGYFSLLLAEVRIETRLVNAASGLTPFLKIVAVAS